MGALQSQHDLLGGLGLLVEHRLGLTTVTGLLSVVTTLTLSEEGSLLDVELVRAPGVVVLWWLLTNLASLVLGDLVLGVLLAVSALAVSAASLGNVDLKIATLISTCSSGVACLYCAPCLVFASVDFAWS